MKLRNSARILKKKSVASLRTSVVAFNSPNDDGRVTAALLHLQHAFEMLLKAALNQARQEVFDPRTGRSISFEQAVRRAESAPNIKLSVGEAGTLRAIDAMRDDEQHWFTEVDEGLLYLHVRAGVTLYDDLLFRVFGDRLADHLPLRVLPISTEAPQDFQFLVDREYAKIAELLKPGRRAGAEARARVRALLAMEAHEDPDTKVSDTDVNRVVKGIRANKGREKVFPRLGGVGANIGGDGIAVEVRFVKQGGLPVTYTSDVTGDADVAAIREVDLQRKYHRSGFEMSDKLRLTRPRGAALREHLGLDADENCVHVFHFGSQRHTRYSDNAFIAMREALKSLDMDAIWQSHGAGRRKAPRPACTQPGCARQKGLTDKV